MGQHQKGKQCIGTWIDAKLLQHLNDEAGVRGIPRSNLIENLIRRELGLPPIDPNPKANRVRWEKKKISKK